MFSAQIFWFSLTSKSFLTIWFSIVCLFCARSIQLLVDSSALCVIAEWSAQSIKGVALMGKSSNKTKYSFSEWEILSPFQAKSKNTVLYALSLAWISLTSESANRRSKHGPRARYLVHLWRRCAVLTDNYWIPSILQNPGVNIACLQAIPERGGGKVKGRQNIWLSKELLRIQMENQVQIQE